MALALGCYDVDAMLASCGPEQLEEWREYHDLEPFGKDWHRTSLATARTLNTVMQMAPVKEGSEREYYEDADFVPSIENARKAEQAMQEQMEAVDDIDGLGI